jgi:hypothetical protein
MNVAIFPPHSTHTLQSADVVLFKPLSTAYSQQLTRRTQRSKGLLPVKKGSFFSLFWPAWLQSFTKDNIRKAFDTTGLHPLNRDKVLKRFPEGAADPSTPPLPPSGTTARSLTSELDSVVADKSSKEACALRQKVHTLAIDNELLRDENDGLSEFPTIKKKQDKKSKALSLVKPALDYWGGARWWSPRSFKEARHRERILKETADAEELEKASVKKLRASNKLYNDKIEEQKREAAAAAKIVRGRERAEERAAIDARKLQRQKDIEACNTQKASQLPNKGKRKDSTTPKTPAAKKRSVVAPHRGAAAPSPPPPARTHTTRSGRTSSRNY